MQLVGRKDEIKQLEWNLSKFEGWERAGAGSIRRKRCSEPTLLLLQKV